MAKPNCSRTAAYSDADLNATCAVLTPSAGNEIPRPAPKQLTSICQPRPMFFCPPITKSIGTNTLLPRVVPL